MPANTFARLGLGLGAVLAVLAAAVAGVILFAAGKASEVDLTTAEFVPADAGIYVAFNTDLSSSSWVSAFELVERLGQDDPEQSLRDSAGEAELDWEDDVVPFLGGNAAVYVSGIDTDSFDFRGGVVIRCRDCAAAIKVIRREADTEFESRTYKDLPYLDGGMLFVGGEKGHIFISPDEESLFAMLDLALGEGESLASTADFKRLRDELSRDFLSFVYLSAEHLIVDELLDDAVVREAFEEAGVANIALKPMALAFGARSNGFEAQAAAVGDAGTSTPLLEPHESLFASLVPADTTVFVHTTGIAAAWDAAISEARPQIDEAIRESTPYDDLDDALRAAGSEVGLESAADVIDELTGESALAVWFPTEDTDEPAVVLLAEVTSTANVMALLQSIGQAVSGESPVTETIAGTLVVSFDDGEEKVSFAAGEGYVILGTGTGVEAVLELEGSGLAGNPDYVGTLEGLSAPTGTFAYFDIPAMVGLAGATPGFVQGIGPAVINLVSDQGLARLLAFVSVPE